LTGSAAGLPRSRNAAVVATAALLLAGAGGIAYAAIPDSGSGVISACRATSNGALRVIDAQAGQSCAGTEKLLTWSGKGINPRGAYNSTAAYRANDSVSNLGSSYVARVANTGVPVTNTINWQLLAGKGAAGPQGPAGAQGPAGEQGATGPQGPAGFSTVQSVMSQPVSLPPGVATVGFVDCPAGKIAISGGESNGGSYNTVYLTDSYPQLERWYVWVNNLDHITQSMNVHAVCVTGTVSSAVSSRTARAGQADVGQQRRVGKGPVRSAG